MSPMSPVAHSKCHGSRQYMAVMQSCINTRNAGKLTGHQRKIDCQKLPLSFIIIIVGNYSAGFIAQGELYVLARMCLCQ